ncbi:hypothetical protein [Hymenobacter yonginensis]|uniref:TFIIB-type zinc ribbon-containing protein n=1 Tax=Hymenobacter yonginensis TaxID=748197 RepID=A0ABY7PTY9_9BACT|nr:hypothetical protein [Hymenobacter yonginensis]WBO86386.1 hypothetical protein O9Z63_09015 [Hymenobacter yonginensis]
MNQPPLMASKKCPHCGFWSPWQQQATDRCERCGLYLDAPRMRSEQKRQELADKPLPSFMRLELKPDDGTVLRFFKHIVRGGQLVFGAIVSFLLWLVAMLAG